MLFLSFLCFSFSSLVRRALAVEEDGDFLGGDAEPQSEGNSTNQNNNTNRNAQQQQQQQAGLSRMNSIDLNDQHDDDADVNLHNPRSPPHSRISSIR